MAKRVFFSFHYQDVIDFRANVVRQHKTTKMTMPDTLMHQSGKMQKKIAA